MGLIGNLYGGIKQGGQGLYDWFKKGLNGPQRPQLGPGGLPGYEGFQQQLGGLMQGGSPYMQGPGQSVYGQDIRQHLSQLQNMARGQGPSLAEGQYQQASDNAMQQQAALAQSGRNPAMAARQAAVGGANIQQGLAAGKAQAKTNEQMGAIGQLNQALGMAGQQELGQMGLQQQANQANQQAFLQMLMAQFGLSEAQAQNLLGYAGLEAGMYGADRAAPTGFDKLMNLFGNIGAVGGGK